MESTQRRQIHPLGCRSFSQWLFSGHMAGARTFWRGPASAATGRWQCGGKKPVGASVVSLRRWSRLISLRCATALPSAASLIKRKGVTSSSFGEYQ
jgi:hypothetical protein